MAVLILAWVVAGWFNNGKERERRKSDFIFPSTDIQYFTFGQKETIADSYWLRTIQDFDVCVNPTAPPGAPRTGLNRQHHCTLDWAYHMLEVVTTLAPRNYVPYNAGGTMLSVVLDDIEGASRIYEKGLAAFPNDWELHFQAATHIMNEVGDLHKAAYYYNIAVQNGGPGWLAALSAKLFDKIGRTELAIVNLRAQLKRAPDEKFAEAVRRKLVELEDKLAAETAEQRLKRDEESYRLSRPPQKK